jgi:hypothetical protein
MAYKIKYYFGDQIRVTPTPALTQWQLRRYPGADGESAVKMGKPGAVITVSGTFSVSANSYADGVEKLYRQYINVLADRFESAADWEYDDLLFKDCILLDLDVEKPYTSGRRVKCKVTATIKQLTV